MDISETNPLADSLVYTAILPLSWLPRKDECQDSEYARIAEHNEHILRCANLLGEQFIEMIDEEADSTLVRLEAKVNLLLELVSKLDQRMSQIPGADEVKVASGGIEWKCNDTPPTVGSSIWINLYLDTRIPEAMKIPAKVIAVSEEPGGTTVGARYECLGEMVQELMEKMIFRHHRRMVAQSRAE